MTSGHNTGIGLLSAFEMVPCQPIGSPDLSRSHPPECRNRSRMVMSLRRDRKSTRLNSSHPSISYAVFCLKKKNQIHSSFYPIRLLQFRLHPDRPLAAVPVHAVHILYASFYLHREVYHICRIVSLCTHLLI